MLNRKVLRDLSQSLRVVYYSRLQATAEQYRAQAELLCSIVQSTEEKIVLRWLGELPVLRKWLGDRKVVEIAAKAWEFMMADFEATVRIHENDLKYDRLQFIRPHVGELARQTNKLPLRETSALLCDGFAGALMLCYDGYPLFSANHANGSNVGTADFDATAFEAAYDAMVAQKDANGEDLEVEPTHLWYHPTLRSKVKEVIGTEKLTGGADNPNFGIVKPLPIRNMAAGTGAYWGLFDLSKELKPFWWAEHPEGALFIEMDQPTSPGRANRKEVVFGVERTGGAALGFPQLAWGSNGTT
jgi:phage major head subunit gpT-like protein